MSNILSPHPTGPGANGHRRLSWMFVLAFLGSVVVAVLAVIGATTVFRWLG
jgi:hypothetical protein